MACPAPAPSHLKMTYFDMGGRAEPTRVALTVAKIPFEDERLSREEWAKVKETMPFRQIPVLTVDKSVQIPQSGAMFEYACRLGGFIPADPLMAAHANAICGCMEDVANRAVVPWARAPADKKEALAAAAVDDHIKKILPLLDAYIGQHQKNGFAVEARVTKADLLVYTWIHVISVSGFPFKMMDYVNENCPHIKACVEAVKAIPEVAAYHKVSAN